MDTFGKTTSFKPFAGNVSIIGTAFIPMPVEVRHPQIKHGKRVPTQRGFFKLNESLCDGIPRQLAAPPPLRGLPPNLAPPDRFIHRVISNAGISSLLFDGCKQGRDNGSNISSWCPL
jgi:hypothetical protein